MHLSQDFDVGKALRQSPVALLKGQGRCTTLFVHAGMLPGLLTALKLHRTEEASPEELLQDLNSKAKGREKHPWLGACLCEECIPDSIILMPILCSFILFLSLFLKS